MCVRAMTAGSSLCSTENPVLFTFARLCRVKAIFCCQKVAQCTQSCSILSTSRTKLVSCRNCCVTLPIYLCMFPYLEFQRRCCFTRYHTERICSQAKVDHSDRPRAPPALASSMQEPLPKARSICVVSISHCCVTTCMPVCLLMFPHSEFQRRCFTQPHKAEECSEDVVLCSQAKVSHSDRP